MNTPKAGKRLVKKPAKRAVKKKSSHEPKKAADLPGVVKIEPGQRAEFHTLNGVKAFAVEWDGEILELRASADKDEFSGAVAIMPPPSGCYGGIEITRRRYVAK